MSNNAFTGNVARQGGAVYNQNSELRMISNDFTNNRAESLYKVDSEDFNLKKNLLVVVSDISTGGGIFFTCVDY